MTVARWQEYRCPVCDHAGSPCPQHDPGQEQPTAARWQDTPEWRAHYGRSLFPVNAEKDGTAAVAAYRQQLRTQIEALPAVMPTYHDDRLVTRAEVLGLLGGDDS